MISTIFSAIGWIVMIVWAPFVIALLTVVGVWLAIMPIVLIYQLITGTYVDSKD